MANQFTESVDSFVKASPWLGDEHAPALAVLRLLASTIDGGRVEAALISQFGLSYRSLVKLAPVNTEGDELGKLLDDAE